MSRDGPRVRVYADESAKRGPFFANFYGGALVRSADLQPVQAQLRRAAADAGFGAEVKWQKVSSGYLDRYLRLMDVFFDLVAADRVKMRIMFTQTRYVPVGLSAAHIEEAYYILYYQFIKHAFGLRYSPPGEPTGLRIYLDELPDSRDLADGFKARLSGLQRWSGFRTANLRVRHDQIAEVRSHDHIVLQCVDVVLGAMQFRLNNKHKLKPPGQRRRGARTIAKEKLYRHINRRIRDIYPNFNVGISTGTTAVDDRWTHPYRHWLFIPRNHRVDPARKKPR